MQRVLMKSDKSDLILSSLHWETHARLVFKKETLLAVSFAYYNDNAIVKGIEINNSRNYILI